MQVQGYNARCNRVPRFIGRQIKARSRGLERLFAFTPSGTKLKVSQCPARFRRVLLKVFQAIQAAKTHSAKTVAFLFNRAAAEKNDAIRKFVALGLEAVSCFTAGHRVILELRSLKEKSKVITLCDAPSAFVAR